MRSWLMLAGVVIALACGSEPAGDAKPGPVDEPHGFDPEARAESPNQEFTLELLDPGVEPRALLRYAERAPSRTIRLSTEQLEDPSKRRPDRAGPPTGPMLVLTLVWTGIEAEGEIRRYLYDKVEVVGGWLFEPFPGEPKRSGREDRTTQALVQSYDRVAGQAAGTHAGLDYVLQTRGISMQPDPGALLEMFAVPFPSEAIGVGASWTRTATREQAVGSLQTKPTPPEQEGPKLPRVLPSPTLEPRVTAHAFIDVERYTLVARDGDMLTIDYAMTSRSDDPAEVPGMTTTGRVEVSPSDPLPRSGTLEVATTIVFPEVEGQPRQHIQIRQRIVLGTRE